MSTSNIYHSSAQSVKTILIAEKTEYEIENIYIMKSPYIRNIKSNLSDNEDLRIILPKWVTKFALEKMLAYLRHAQCPEINDTNLNGIQRLLWLSDFLGIDEFQHRFIKEKVIPSLTASNCLIFLNESFKKLKSSEESSDSWYVLFNFSMNTLAKNLEYNYAQKRNELMQMNDKILEEVIERSLKYNKNHFNTDQKAIIDVLTTSRKKADVFELLESQRRIVLNKKFINGPNQPNITWKLSNLSKISEKETSSFKFGGFSWKLVAKMLKGENQLVFHLRFDTPLDALTAGESAENTYNSVSYSTVQPSQDGILTIYFVMKTNGVLVHREIQIKSLNIKENPTIKLHTLRQQEINELSGRENEFVVNLNLEYTYAAILIHISKNIDKYHQNKSVALLSRDDVCAVFRNLGNTDLSFTQEYALSFVSTWLAHHRDEREPADILQTIDLQQINANILSKALTSDGFRGNQAAYQYLERQLAIKNGEDPDSASRNSVYRASFASEAKLKKTDGGEQLREPLKTNPSPVFLPRGRFMNQSYQNGEPDHPRHSSLQRDPTYKSAHSLNTSLRSNEIPYVPKILNNRTLATEQSPDIRDLRYPKVSSSPKRHDVSAERDSVLRSQQSGPILGNLSYVDKRASLQTLYSPTGNISMVNNPPNTDGKKTPMGMSVSTGREIFGGGHGVTNAGFMSAVTSPTYTKPDFSTMGSNSMHYQSNKETVSAGLSEQSKSAGPKGNFSLSSSFNSSNLLRRGNDRRIMTESEDGVNLRGPRDSSITRGTAGIGTVGSMAGRESYSNLDYSSKYDRFEKQSLEEVREQYTAFDKTTQEKIAMIRRCLWREKEDMRMDVFSQVDVRMYLANGKQQLFD